MFTAEGYNMEAGEFPVGEIKQEQYDDDGEYGQYSNGQNTTNQNQPSEQFGGERDEESEEGMVDN